MAPSYNSPKIKKHLMSRKR